MDIYSPMQLVKRRFFAMRNGVVADALRKGGLDYQIIFGLNIPQIVEIAHEFGPDPILGRLLWDNTTTRESLLLAPMLMDAQNFTEDEATKWIESVNSIEVADVLCHRLLRHTSYAVDLAEKLSTSNDSMYRYIAVRLMFNLVYNYPKQAAAIAKSVSEKHCNLTDAVALSLADEAAFVLSSN